MNEKLNEALDGISDKHIHEAAKAKKRRPYWFGAVAAILAVAILAGVFWGPGRNGAGLLANQVAAAEYPEMAQKPDYGDYAIYENYSAAMRQWRNAQDKQYSQPQGYADSLADFFGDSMAEFLSGEENRVYSPLNVYMAMAMLAETTDGNTRQQILELFGVETIETLRQQAGHVWNAHYSNDGETTTVLANSLWLDSGYDFHQDTVGTLANDYYASVFHGDLGTGSMNEQLRTWLNDQTGGLLKEQNEKTELTQETVFALASTVYFKAGWEYKFNEKSTTNATFHGAAGDVTVPFMNQTIYDGIYYWGSNFNAVYLRLTGENKMWLILPDEGVPLEDVLQSREYPQMTQDPDGWENQTDLRINLSLPKFDISSQMDLVDGMKRLGLSDVFDYTVSDFTPITGTGGLYVSTIDHAARVTIDEEGCTAAAYTVAATNDGGMPPDDEIDFVLDRPFLFIVSSRDDLPLFAGTVIEP